MSKGTQNSGRDQKDHGSRAMTRYKIYKKVIFEETDKRMISGWHWDDPASRAMTRLGNHIVGEVCVCCAPDGCPLFSGYTSMH